MRWWGVLLNECGLDSDIEIGAGDRLASHSDLNYRLRFYNLRDS